MNIEYNKLVRDNIPSQIEKTGIDCKYLIMDDEQYMAKLIEKMHEKLQDFESEFDSMNDEKAIHELAELQEVILALVVSVGVTEESFERIRNAKKKLDGGYDNKVLLLEACKNVDDMH